MVHGWQTHRQGMAKTIPRKFIDTRSCCLFRTLILISWSEKKTWWSVQLALNGSFLLPNSPRKGCAIRRDLLLVLLLCLCKSFQRTLSCFTEKVCDFRHPVQQLHELTPQLWIVSYFLKAFAKLMQKIWSSKSFRKKIKNNHDFSFYFTKEQGQNRATDSTLSLLYMIIYWSFVSRPMPQALVIYILHKHLKAVFEIRQPIRSSGPEPYRLPRLPQTSPCAGIQIYRRRSHWGMFSHFDYNPVLPHWTSVEPR